MKLPAFATLAGLVALGVARVHATPIQITYNPVLTQPTNEGIGTVAAWSSAAISTFNADSDPGSPLPALGATEFRVTPGGVTYGTAPLGWPGSFTASTTMSINLPVGGYDYIVLSWGGSKIPDHHGTADFLYYIGGTSGYVTFSRPSLAGGGLSSITVYGGTPCPCVPDTATTAVLLVAGLAGLGVMRRRRA